MFRIIVFRSIQAIQRGLPTPYGVPYPVAFSEPVPVPRTEVIQDSGNVDYDIIYTLGLSTGVSISMLWEYSIMFRGFTCCKIKITVCYSICTSHFKFSHP